jgi:hypothetical protein
VKLERITTIYTELDRYAVQLQPDPRSLGPLYLNDLIAKTRNFLNAVSRIQLEVHQEKQHMARELRAREAAYQVSADDLLANDERVRRLPSIEDRKATVSVFLRDERQIIERLKAEIQDIEYVEKAVRHRHKELTSTMSEIKLQRSLIRDEIDTGAMYGDERRFDHERRPQVNPAFGGEDIDEKELERLLVGESAASVESALAVEPPAPEMPSEPPVEVKSPEVPENVTEMAIQAFLDGGEGQTMSDLEDDFEELLKTI